MYKKYDGDFDLVVKKTAELFGLMRKIPPVVDTSLDINYDNYTGIDQQRCWPEDYGHENGRYMNQCIVCKELFVGHKRRGVCKECSGVKQQQNVTDPFTI
jgi:hypothetical protein